MFVDPPGGQLLQWMIEGLPDGAITDVAVAIWQPDSTRIITSSETARHRAINFGCLQEAVLGAYACALIDDGRISLDDPVSAYLPELETLPYSILISHLLSKSSGFWARESPALSGNCTWVDFCRSNEVRSPRFQPGLIVTHSLLERFVLVELIRRVVDDSPYEAIAGRLFGRPADELIERAQGAFSECYADLRGTVDDLVRFLDSADKTSWWGEIARSAGTLALFEAPCPKDWAATAAGLGLFQLGNGLWGQDGDSAEGYAGLRLCPSSRTAVAGIFGTPFAREHILARTCADLFGFAMPQRDGRLGTLNHQDPAALSGEYQGMPGMRLSVEHRGEQLNFPTQNTRMNLPADIHPDGSLTARWAGPTFWVEPRILPSAEVGIRFGRHFYIKETSKGT